MKPRSLALVFSLLVAACVATVPATPQSPAPPASAPPLASTGGAPTLAAASDEDSGAIHALVGSMADAVVAGDRDAYLALVDTSDPVFATEHRRWVDEWAGTHPVSSYSLALNELAIAGDSATGTLTVSWQLAADVEARTATFAARFSRAGTGWRYAGEAWTSTDVPHFEIHVAPGLEAHAPVIADALPDVYEHVTTALDHAPAADLQIKLYRDPPALVANTLLSLPEIAGWNEPGEALKLNGSGDPQRIPSVIAHELAHFVGFDRAGTQRTRMPWWLDEGVATLVGTTLEGPPVDPGRLAQVAAWEEAGELAPWDDMVVFEETPLELWEFVYPQGYAMAVFVTERFGVDRRNRWLAAMATEMDIEAATPAELGRTFDELDSEFREWLPSKS